MRNQIRMSLLPLCATRLLQGLEYTAAPRIRSGADSFAACDRICKLARQLNPPARGRISCGPVANCPSCAHAQVEWSRRAGLELSDNPCPVCGWARMWCIGGCVESSEETLAVDIALAGASVRFGCDPYAGMRRWYALYVRSRHEKVVESGLRGKGYVAFSPFYRTKRHRRSTGSPKSMYPCFQATFFATLTQTNVCRF